MIFLFLLILLFEEMIRLVYSRPWLNDFSWNVIKQELLCFLYYASHGTLKQFARLETSIHCLLDSVSTSTELEHYGSGAVYCFYLFNIFNTAYKYERQRRPKCSDSHEEFYIDYDLPAVHLVSNHSLPFLDSPCNRNACYTFYILPWHVPESLSIESKEWTENSDSINLEFGQGSRCMTQLSSTSESCNRRNHHVLRCSLWW